MIRKGFPAAVDSFAVPSADKRQRKKENARAAREAREAAEKRRRQLKLARNVGIVVALFVIIIVVSNIVSGGGKKKSASTTSTTLAPATTIPVSAPDFKVDPSKTYTATIATNFGEIVVGLDTKNDPVGAGHFIKLAQAGVYNGSRWHRIAKDFVIQGGAPGGDPNKTYGHSVVAEVPTNNYPLGSLAAAKTGQDAPGTFDSQFFIVSGSQGATLPNDYARFGSVKSGMDVVQKIAALVPASGDGEPTKPATITKVTISES